MTMNGLFYACVQLLRHWAKLTHMTYEEINIWIFVIIEPIVFFFMLYIIIRQWNLIRKYKPNSSVK